MFPLTSEVAGLWGGDKILSFRQFEFPSDLRLPAASCPLLLGFVLGLLPLMKLLYFFMLWKSFHAGLQAFHGCLWLTAVPWWCAQDEVSRYLVTNLRSSDYTKQWEQIQPGP